MAEDVENPRKKQKLDTLFPDADASEAVPSLSDDLATNPCKEETSLTGDFKKLENCQKEADQIKPSTSAEDGGDDMGKPDGPSCSRLDVSDISGSESDSSALSPLSGEDMWKADAEPLGWVYRMMANGDDPREVLEKIIPGHIPDVDERSLWRLLISIVTEPPPREKLPTVNTLEDVIQLIQTCKNIIVLTGAGVSVSCGIPDFRSRNGIYARLAVDFPDLPDPQAMFDINYFRKDQRPFFKFAKEIYPGQFKPSICHQFIRLIEEQEKLLRNYTQNIDTLEQVAGIQNVIQCHGSFATATCMVCKHKCSADEIKGKIMDQVIPQCPKCDPPTCWSVMKPDIVFFGESLSDEFHQQMAADKDKCDLLIVIGSSLKVRPVALIPNSLPAHVPQVLINKEHLRDLNFDVELLGDCDIIVSELCRHLGDRWQSLANKDNPLREIRVDELLTPPETPPYLRDRKDRTDDNKQETVHDNLSRTNEAEAGGEKVVEPSGDDKSKFSEINKTTEEKSESLTSIEHVETDKYDDKNANDDGSVVFKKASNEVSNVKGQDAGRQASSGDAGTSDKTNESSESTIIKSGVTTKDEDKTKPGFSAICSDKAQEETDAQKNKSQEGETTKDTSDVDLKSMWMPSKWLVSKRLASNQYCFMPPNRYVFNDAEVFMVFDSSDSDNSDDSSGSDSDSYKSNDQDVIMVDGDSDVLVNDSKSKPENTEDELKDTDGISSKDECDILKETSSNEGCGIVGRVTDNENDGISGSTPVNKQGDGDIS